MKEFTVKEVTVFRATTFFERNTSPNIFSEEFTKY